MSEGRLISANTKTFSADLPVIMDAVSKAGFSGIEVWDADLSSYKGDVKGLADFSNLQLSAFQLLRDFEGCGATLMAQKLEEAEKLMEVMRTIGADTLLMCANTQETSSSNRSEQISDLKTLTRMASSRGLRIGFEPLAWSKWIGDYELANACVEAVNDSNFGLVLDVFHLFSRGTSIKVVEELDIKKLFLVQLSDAIDLELSTIEIARHHRLFPGEGAWPVGEVVQRLESRGFSGYFSLEVFNDEYRRQDPYDVARRGIASFHSSCGALV